MIRNISDRRPRGNHTKPRIESSEFAQKRLEGRLTQPSFLWPRRILERLQAIQNQYCSAMHIELCQSFALLLRCSDPWIGIAKPSESHVKKFIGGRSLSTGSLSVKRPAKYELRRTIVFSSHPSEPMVHERLLPDPSPSNYCNNIHIRVCPGVIQ